jgi:hypothetical protein
MARGAFEGWEPNISPRCSAAGRRGAILAGAVCVLLWTSVVVQAAASDLYAGTTITIIVGSSLPSGQAGLAQTLGRDAGVSGDAKIETFAQILARFLGRHVPGSPRVRVQDLPGEGGLAPVIYLKKAAPKNGTVLSVFDPGILTDSFLGLTGAAVNVSKVSWIGAMAPDFRVCYARRSTGVRDWNDLAQRGSAFAFGAAGIKSSSYLDAEMLHSLFKLRIRPILGYRDAADIALAIARGELDGACGSIADLPRAWLSGNQIQIFLRLVAEPVPYLAEQPPYVELFAKSSEQQRVVELLTGSSEIGAPLIASKRTPPDRLAILRAAFAATMRDPDFLAAAWRRSLPVVPLDGATEQRKVENLSELAPIAGSEAREAVK